MEFLTDNSFFLPRLIFERSLAFIYVIAFFVALNQFPALLGEQGLLPVPRFLKYVKYRQAPSLFHWHYSDHFFKYVCGAGLLLSLALTLGLSAYLHPLAHILTWLLIYFLYLSITHVGQVFYGFGWESMLCEAGFFMAFMGPQWMQPSWLPIFILRWMLFRTEMGAGLIKLRGDICWKDYTALYYHHETQPMPNPLSRYFHHLPKSFLRHGVRFSHFVQLIAPFGLFLPQPLAALAGVLIILHQLILIIGGNYSWLNWLTVVLGVLAFSYPEFPSDLAARPIWYDCSLILLGFFTLYLSRQPLMNLISKTQRMNYCWNRYNLVGAYGAFGSVTKKRYELIIEGSQDGISWMEYEFKAKPGALKRRPPQWAPYHLRLDWMMWFLPFSVMVGQGQVYVMKQEEWFLRFLQKLLHNDLKTLKLIKYNPFPHTPPLKIRVRYYQYHFTDNVEFKRTKQYWKRELIGEYLPALDKDAFVE